MNKLTKHPKRTWTVTGIGLLIATGKYTWDALSHISTFETLPEDLQRFNVDWIQPIAAFLWNPPGWFLPVVGGAIIVGAHVADRLWDRVFSNAHKPDREDTLDPDFKSALRPWEILTRRHELLLETMKPGLEGHTAEVMEHVFGVLPATIETLFGATARNAFLKKMESVKERLISQGVKQLDREMILLSTHYIAQLGQGILDDVYEKKKKEVMDNHKHRMEMFERMAEIVLRPV